METKFCLVGEIGGKASLAQVPHAARAVTGGSGVVHHFQSIHNSDIFEVRGVQIENNENRMVSQNSVNETTNFNLSCAVALYYLC